MRICVTVFIATYLLLLIYSSALLKQCSGAIVRFSDSSRLNFNLYDVRWWSEILFSMISTPGHDLQVKVTDLDILYRNLECSLLKLLGTISP